MDRRGERDLEGVWDRGAGDRVRVRPREGDRDGIDGGGMGRSVREKPKSGSQGWSVVRSGCCECWAQ